MPSLLSLKSQKMLSVILEWVQVVLVAVHDQRPPLCATRGQTFKPNDFTASQSIQ